jgi:hypothetical protein
MTPVTSTPIAQLNPEPVPSISLRSTFCYHHISFTVFHVAAFNMMFRTVFSSLMMEAVRTSETSVDNHFTRQYIPEDNSEHHTRRRENLKSHMLSICFPTVSTFMQISSAGEPHI